MTLTLTLFLFFFFLSPCWLFSFLYSIHIRKRQRSFMASIYLCLARGTPCFLHEASQVGLTSKQCQHITQDLFGPNGMLVNAKNPVEFQDDLQFWCENVLNVQVAKLVECITPLMVANVCALGRQGLRLQDSLCTNNNAEPLTTWLPSARKRFCPYGSREPEIGRLFLSRFDIAKKSGNMFRFDVNGCRLFTKHSRLVFN